MKGVSFFPSFACEESKNTCSRWVLGLQISATMASRFEIVDEEYIELKDKSENDNMKKRTEYWKNFLKKGANERNFKKI